MEKFRQLPREKKQKFLSLLFGFGLFTRTCDHYQLEIESFETGFDVLKSKDRRLAKKEISENKSSSSSSNEQQHSGVSSKEPYIPPADYTLERARPTQIVSTKGLPRIVLPMSQQEAATSTPDSTPPQQRLQRSNSLRQLHRPQQLLVPTYKQIEETTVFRTPAKTQSNVVANSYVGWHQYRRRHSISSIHALQQEAEAQQQHRQYNNEKAGNHLPSSYIAFGGAVFVMSAALKIASTSAPRYTQPPYIDTKLSEDVESTISFFPRSKYRIAALLVVLLVILGALIAMSVAIISQVTTHSNMVRLVRQYEGRFVVIGGEMLELTPDILDPTSSIFAERAAQYTDILNQVFQRSHASSVYEGVEVLQFRILPELAALEVQFAVKTSVEATIDAAGLVRILYDSIKNRLSKSIADIDLQSVMIEDQRIS